MTGTVQSSLSGGEVSNTVNGISMAGIANAAKIRDPKTNAAEPHSSFSTTDTEYGVETRWYSSTPSVKIPIEPHHVRWVVGGDLEAYADNYGDCGVSIPSSYSAFGEFEPYLAQRNTAIEGHGFGISATGLERALRVLTGGGRYNAAAYTCIACGTRPWILTGPEGTVLCSPVPVTVDDPNEARPPTTVDFPGDVDLETVDENENVQEGLFRVAHAIDGAFSPADYEVRAVTGNPGLHNFYAESGRLLAEAAGSDVSDDDVDEDYSASIDGATLERIGRSIATPERARQLVSDIHTVVQPSDIPQHEVGDEHPDGGLIVGFELYREDHPESPESTIGIQTLIATTSRYSRRNDVTLRTDRERIRSTPATTY